MDIFKLPVSPNLVSTFLRYLHTHEPPHNNVILRRALRGQIQDKYICMLEGYALTKELIYISHSSGYIGYTLTTKGLALLHEQPLNRPQHTGSLKAWTARLKELLAAPLFSLVAVA